MQQSRELRVRDTVVQEEGTVLVDRTLQDRPRYRVSLYLEGADLPYVREVVYHLHHTFPQPRRTVRRSSANPNCELIIWTWGVFEIRVQVKMKNGDELWLRQRLTYDRQLSRKDIRLVEVTPNSQDSS
jgi:transcription initiation factor IIF auxiliary subunit